MVCREAKSARIEEETSTWPGSLALCYKRVFSYIILKEFLFQVIKSPLHYSIR